jgi:hypothetical protein
MGNFLILEAPSGFPSPKSGGIFLSTKRQDKGFSQGSSPKNSGEIPHGPHVVGPGTDKPDNKKLVRQDMKEGKEP